MGIIYSSYRLNIDTKYYINDIEIDIYRNGPKTQRYRTIYTKILLLATETYVIPNKYLPSCFLVSLSNIYMILSTLSLQ